MQSRCQSWHSATDGTSAMASTIATPLRCRLGHLAESDARVSKMALFAVQRKSLCDVNKGFGTTEKESRVSRSGLHRNQVASL